MNANGNQKKFDLPLSVVTEYLNGKSVKILAAQYECSENTIRNFLTKHGAHKRATAIKAMTNTVNECICQVMQLREQAHAQAVRLAHFEMRLSALERQVYGSHSFSAIEGNSRDYPHH